jgi:nitroreductase
MSVTDTFVPEEDVPPLTADAIEKLKHAPDVPGVLEPILRRWSPRAFADRQVPAADLKKLFEAARWAASSSNEQPWRYLVGRKGDETYKKIFDSLVDFNKSWAGRAPVLVLSAAKKTFSGKAHPNRFALHDTGAATAILSLQATALGLHTHPMAGFDAETARAFFGIPHDYELGSVTAIGYLGDPSTLPGSLREKEEAPREREPVEKFVFSSWDVSASL